MSVLLSTEVTYFGGRPAVELKDLIPSSALNQHLGALAAPSGKRHLGALLEKDPLVVNGEHHRERRLMPFPLHTAPYSD